MNKNVKHLMFCANDARKHDVCWSPLGKYWMLENFDDGMIARYTHLMDALADMRRHTLANEDKWTVNLNPYGD